MNEEKNRTSFDGGVYPKIIYPMPIKKIWEAIVIKENKRDRHKQTSKGADTD